MPIGRKNPHLTVLSDSQIDIDIRDNFILDRTFGETLTLPFSYESLKVKPNEFAIADNINATLYKLYFNFLYLNSRCKLSSGNLPTEFNGVLQAPSFTPIPSSETFVISNHYDKYFIINGHANPIIDLVKGGIYKFHNTTTGSNPFFITNIPYRDQWIRGVQNSGAPGPESTLIFEVPLDCPDTLYYYSGSNARVMHGKINILPAFRGDVTPPPICVDPTAAPTAVEGNKLFRRFGKCNNLQVPDEIIYTGTLSGAEDLTWYTKYIDGQICEDSYLPDVVASTFIDTEYAYGEFYLGILATKTHLLTLELDFDSTLKAIREYETKVESATDIVFEDISSIAASNVTKMMYVADKKQNKIYQYNIKNYIGNSPVLRERGKILVNSIGGQGVDRDREGFDNPISVKIGPDDNVYVLDYRKGANSSIKIYDPNLNWIRTITRRADFTEIDPVDLTIDPINKQIYVLGSAGSIYVYDDSDKGSKIRSLSITESIYPDSDDMVFKRLDFSIHDPNVMYIQDVSGIAKVWSKKFKLVGTFNFNKFNISDISINSMAIYRGTYAPDDTIFVMAISKKYAPCGKIFRFTDKHIYTSTIYDEYKQYCYGFHEVRIKAEENVTYISLNRSFEKLIYNHHMLKDNIHSIYSGEHGEDNEDIYTKLIRPIGVRGDVMSHQITSEELIGVNEIVLSETLNRPIKKIFDFQSSILSTIQPYFTNFYPQSGAPISLR